MYLDVVLGIRTRGADGSTELPMAAIQHFEIVFFVRLISILKTTEAEEMEATNVGGK